MDETHRIPDAVLLLTDVVDSTRLTSALGDDAMERVWRQHDAAARALLSRWNGTEVDRTDGFLLLFERVDDALGWAKDFHRALAGLSDSLGISIQARAGVHVGPALLLENSEEDRARGAKTVELEGLAKPVAARIMSAARGGQTLLSKEAVDRCTRADLRTRSHGLWRMKGLDAPIELFGLVTADGALDPPLDGEKVWRVVETADGWRPARQLPSHLPAERDAFFGREVELRALVEALDAGGRAITLLGPGGVGKTRLAVHFGRMWLGDWPGGVWLCELSEARDGDAVARAVALALDVPLGRGEAGLQLGHAIAARGRCLIVLDGAEYAAEAAAGHLGRWLDRAPEAAFLVTSRARLRMPGERILAVEPLTLDPAVALFIARVRAHSPGFLADGAVVRDIQAIVRLLDGLPLALELAAARARVLSPARIAERLGDRFALLVGGRAGPRQSTLRATLDWSWDLLDLPQRAALAQLSVFEGGFTLEAAESVLDLSPWPGAPEVWELLEALEEQSLIQPLDPSSQRLGLLSVMRAYAAERLAGSPDLRPGSGPAAVEAAFVRHGHAFAAQGGPALRAALHGPDGPNLRRRLAPEIGNIEAACERAVQRGDAAVALATLEAAWAVIAFRGPYPRGLALAEAVLSLPLEGLRRIHALAFCATARQECGDRDRARAELAEAVRLARSLGARAELSPLLGDLGVMLAWAGQREEGRELVAESIALARALGQTRNIAANLVRLGNLCEWAGESEAAVAHFEQGLVAASTCGDKATEGIIQVNLGIVHGEAGRPQQAERAYLRALEIARALGAAKSECVALCNLGSLLLETGRMVEAEPVLRSALALSREIGNRAEEGIIACNLAILCSRRDDQSSAEAHTCTALQISRESGNARLEVAALSTDADRLLTLDQPARALAVATEAGTVARRARLPLDAARVRKVEAVALARLGRASEARIALEEAEQMAAALQTGPDSALSRELALAREEIAPPLSSDLRY